MDTLVKIIFIILWTITVFWATFFVVAIVFEGDLLTDFAFKHVYLIASGFFPVFLVWVANSSFKPFKKKNEFMEYYKPH